MISLYIHFPYCVSKCPYCDFYSIVRTIDNDGTLFKAYERDLYDHASILPGKGLASIFFGGGTPSLMSPTLVSNLIQLAKSLWTPMPNIEITLETNPNSVDQDRFYAFKEGGVNRLSLGVQALSDDALLFLGRLHSFHDAWVALEKAYQIFPRTSFDLIYARPNQSASDWEQELSLALSVNPTHLSLYQLTIEEGTAFYNKHKRGDFTMPSEALSEELFDMTQEMTKDLLSYEVSNHAKSGHESLHNLFYWRYQDYIGIGPAAHGRYDHNGIKWATYYPKNLEVWLQNNDCQKKDPLSTQDQFNEFMMMGLRLTEGLDMTKFQSFWNQQILDSLKNEGYANIHENRLALTMEGRKRHSSIVKLLSCS